MLEAHMPEMWPQFNALIEVNDFENFPKNATGKSYRESLEARNAE